jgi:hypothetical protein
MYPHDGLIDQLTSNKSAGAIIQTDSVWKLSPGYNLFNYQRVNEANLVKEAIPSVHLVCILLLEKVVDRCIILQLWHP